MLIYRLLVGLVAAVIIKYQVLSWNISGKQDTTSVYYNAGPGLLTSTTIQGGTTDIYYDTRRDYWHLLQHEGALLKQLTRVLEYQGTVNTGAILSYRTISFSPDVVARKSRKKKKEKKKHHCRSHITIFGTLSHGIPD